MKKVVNWLTTDLGRAAAIVAVVIGTAVGIIEASSTGSVIWYFLYPITYTLAVAVMIAVIGGLVMLALSD